MTPQIRHCLSFAVMTLLVFIGTNLLLVGWISTGPHRYISFGITGWLTLYRYGEAWLPQGLRWSIESVSIVRFGGEAIVACLLTGILSQFLKWVKARLHNGRPGAAPNGGSAKELGSSSAHGGSSLVN